MNLSKGSLHKRLVNSKVGSKSINTVWKILLDIKLLNSQNIPLISKEQKKNIISTMDDVRGDFLGPPHGTTSAVEITNKNINISYFESSDKTQKTQKAILRNFG